MISVFQTRKAFAAQGQQLSHREGINLYDQLVYAEAAEVVPEMFPIAFESHTPPDFIATYKAFEEEELAHGELRSPPLTNRRTVNRPVEPNAWKEY